ncbi:transcriptional regulator with XRE-family HTH domain [Streptomyces eurocidicus]|uniref:Transcriptional regulator with XRE-family HTH domain n=1 Tax=Streptomyces eurocidicus TaxID=66423 RepID=A0A7W8B4U8_STREU|nr:transcriptional regulator with XRE-family HTH domain [Streptomyces eurocidicus]
MRRAVVVGPREEKGLKLREVAELLGLSVPRVDQIAKGK